MSEDHLQEWLGFTSEDMFHRRSLVELRNIMNSLCIYTQIHLEMECGENLEIDKNVKKEKWSLGFLFRELFYPERPHYPI